MFTLIASLIHTHSGHLFKYFLVRSKDDIFLSYTLRMHCTFVLITDTSFLGLTEGVHKGSWLGQGNDGKGP